MKPIPKAKDRSLRSLLQKITDLGGREAKIINPRTVETAPWVRWKCQFGCGGYNSSLMCPPHSRTPEETRKVLDSYKRAILFETGRLETKKIATKIEREAFLSGYYKALGLTPDLATSANPAPSTKDAGIQTKLGQQWKPAESMSLPQPASTASPSTW